MAQNKYLKQNGEIIYPFTLATDVFDAETGNPYPQTVENELEAILEDQKNVFCPLPSTNSLTTNGITFTRAIADRRTQYINVNGTATSTAFYNLNSNFTLISGRKYILSGWHSEHVSGCETHIRYADEAVTIARAGKDDVEFVCPNRPIFLYMVVSSGSTVSNKKYYPMIRDTRITSDSYLPYVPSATRWMLATQVFNSSSVTIAAGASGSININTSAWNENRRPLAILRTWSNGNIIINYSNNNSRTDLTSVTVWYRNTTSSSVTVYFSVEILFIDAQFVI